MKKLNKKTNLKKTIYIILTMFLCLLLVIIAHAFIEIVHIKKMLAAGTVISDISNGQLNLFVGFVMYMFGILGGYFLGQTWWRIIYVEKRRWRYKKK